MTGRWNTVEQETVYTCEGFDIVSEDVQLPGGESAAFDYLSESESVVVLPFTDESAVVIIDEWRHAVRRQNRGIPAGSVEPGENPDRAARRELREETGYRAGSLDHMTTVEPANGFSDAVFHYYVARDCTDTARQDLDDDESIDVDTASLEGLLGRARDGDLRDGRTAFAVVYYALFEAPTDGGIQPGDA
jgi:ADP-ribose pyrophosphatase